MQHVDAISEQEKVQEKFHSETVSVLLAIPLDIPFDYSLPTGTKLATGSIVRVPFRGRIVFGAVWGASEGKVEKKSLKEIDGLVDAPPLKHAIRELVDWAASYNLSKRGAVLKMILSSQSALMPPNKINIYQSTNTQPDKLTSTREKVLKELSNKKSMTVKEIVEATGVSTSVIKGLVNIGCLQELEQVREPNFLPPNITEDYFSLSPPQLKATESLIRHIHNNIFSVSLLDGVTGSGKTEVYFEVMKPIIASGKQVLILLPEIALSTQWLHRFTERFGTKPAIWHSDISNRVRADTWRAVCNNSVSIVVGARSALWLPFSELGLIIVDEEHDSAYKQEEGVIYHARDMAVARGKKESSPVLLVSATPSLETIKNVDMGKYNRVNLPDRYANAKMPTIDSIDMRQCSMPSNRWLAPKLIEEIRATLNTGEQAALFLNRRGYAPLTLCRACGHRLQCTNCSAWLVEHRDNMTLNCHHCGFSMPKIRICPSCNVEGKLAPCGPGVERIAEEVLSFFPDINLDIATSDTMTGPKEAEKLIKRIESGESDVIVGTQIISKGYHFPMLTLIGIVDADLGLSGGDLRAAEQTYQLLHQVSGRAGRAERKGRVILQTYMPDHPVIKALAKGNRDNFLKQEAEARSKNSLPPYGRLAALIFSGTNNQTVSKAARDLVIIAKKSTSSTDHSKIIVLGPAPAPLTYLRGKYRYRVLVKAREDILLQPHLKKWIESLIPISKVRIQIDVDPRSFL